MSAQPSQAPAATSLPEMSLPEWLVLAILARQPAHGFAVAQLTAPDGDLGRVWQIPKAVVYRAIGRLLDADLIVPESTERGQGPQRTVYTATPPGSEAADRWLHTPVEHGGTCGKFGIRPAAWHDRRCCGRLNTPIWPVRSTGEQPARRQRSCTGHRRRGR